MSKLTPKKYLTLVAFWLVGIISVICASIYSKQHEGDEYAAVAIPYIQEAIAEISLWDPAKAKALMAPEVASTIPDEKFVRAMDFFSQLGTLQSMEEPNFQTAFVDQETDIGKQTILEYDVETLYEHGEAEINLKLLKRGDGYEIYRFNFMSEKLMPQQEK